MFLAHLPAGYIISKFCLNNAQDKIKLPYLFIAVGMLGAIFPDFDLIYFYLIDHRQHPHHAYFTHFPIFWFSIFLVCVLWIWLKRQSQRAIYFAIFSLNACVHLVLDTCVGDIRWLTPISNQSFSVFTVPALHDPWWLNFFFHWSFLVELIILVWAVIVFYKDQNIKSTQ